MEQGSIGDKILVGLMIWFLLGQWLLFLVFALPFLLPAVAAVGIIWIVRVFVNG